MIRLLALLLLAPLLGGCLQTFGGSVAGGGCKFIERPPYAVRGLRQYDQDWVDSTIEGGVGACHWKRPAPRPPALDAGPARKAAVAPPKKRGLLRRIRDRVRPAAQPDATAPALSPEAPAEVPAPSPVEPAAAPPAPATTPRSAIDELLHPTR